MPEVVVEDLAEPEVAILLLLRQVLLTVDMDKILNLSKGNVPAKSLRRSHVHELFEIRILFTGTGTCQESYSEVKELRLTPAGLIHSGLNQNEIANHITIRFDVDSLYYVRAFRILEAPLHHELEHYGINLNNLLMTLNSFCSGELDDKEHLRCALAHFISALALYMHHCKIQVHDQLVSRICSYIHENYHRGDLTIAEIAGKAGISANYIQKVFRKSQQCTPKEYLVNYRLHTAQRLLRQHRYRIKEVATLSGWNCPHYFANAYHRKFGHYPSEEN